MRAKPDYRPAVEQRGSMIVQTTLYDLVSAVECEMESDSDKEVAKAVSGILEKRRPRKPWKAVVTSVNLSAAEKTGR